MLEIVSFKHKMKRHPGSPNLNSPSHTSLPKKLENSPPNNFIEATALKVIEKKTFIIPKGVHEKKFLGDPKKHILKNWPMEKAVKILSGILEIETFGLQNTSTRFLNNQDYFSLPFFKIEGGFSSNKENIPWISNIFWNKNLLSTELPYSKSTEASKQKAYQNFTRDSGLDLVYLKDIETLLKSKKLIKDTPQDELKNYLKRITIVSIPKENMVIVLSFIGQRASGRMSPRPMPIIFKTKNSKELVEFLSSYKTQGLNAIYSLLGSEEITPQIPLGCQREEIFYADENQDEKPFVVKAQLKEFEISKTDGTSLGKVKRLRSIED